jgi:hypothetical protein
MGFSVPAGSTFEFTDFRVPLTFSSGTTDVNFTIASADMSGKPSTALETITVSGMTTGSEVYTGDSALHPILTSGNYWLEAAIVPTEFGLAFWNTDVPLTSLTPLGPVATMASPFAPPGWGFDNQVQSAFEIDGLAVPEPSSVLFLVCFLGACMYRRFRTGNRERS